MTPLTKPSTTPDASDSATRARELKARVTREHRTTIELIFSQILEAREGGAVVWKSLDAGATASS